MNDEFDTVLDLAQKLKGPMVVYDKQGGRHLVILGIDEFTAYLDSNKPLTVPPANAVKTPVNQEKKGGITETPSELNQTIESEPQEQAGSLQEVVGEVEPVKPLVNIPKAPNQDWHRLGDVMRRVRPEIASSEPQKPVPYQLHEEPLAETDEVSFLEEPIS